MELIEGQGSPIFCITRHLDAGYFGEKWSTWLGSADFVFSETVQPGTFGSDIYIYMCIHRQTKAFLNCQMRFDSAWEAFSWTSSIRSVSTLPVYIHIYRYNYTQAIYGIYIYTHYIYI